LMQTKIKQAKEAFEKAIAVDSADPLSRLGLGLAKIRESNLNEGSRELEAAASLDPSNAIVRSYLGKAYYEEKRTGLDEREYAEAKKLDPNDPTPHFYDAIAKQTTNRPVEALQEMQQAIELNDNRAVYRSRLLLDSDEASRSAAQGRIYTDLGFQQLALVEGWKSVNIDPTNFSAHRLLADTYATLPRHEIARVSELLQSQLLQPLNNTPIQPRLAESNLFLISAGGPGALSFNEFNPIFNRDGVAFQATGLVGENKTWAGEAVLGGIYRKVSFSLGYTGFETKGWRTNADQHDRIANALVQLELTPQTSLQAEYRYRNEEHGDLQQRFFPDAFFPGLTNELDRHSVRLGGRHAFSPGSVILTSLTYQKSDRRELRDEFAGPDTFIDSKLPEKAYGAELQHLFRAQNFNLTSGVGYFNVDGEIQSSIGLFGIVDDLPDVDTKFDHINLYAYGNINLLKNLTGTAGISYDNLSGDLPGSGESQINPKFGLTWNPFRSTTVRAAAFRTLKRTLITDQTLEPTQVAGFNQFFDDRNLTDAWRYGAAIDQKFGRSVYGGVELSKRDMTVPFIDLNSDTQEADWEEGLGRAYLFWTPHRWLALSGQYIFERFERSDRLLLGFKELDTHRVPLGISVFHPSGLGASVTATYWNQEGRFEDINTAELRAGRDDFWLFDTAISYRLPKRYGFITVGATNLFDKEFRYFEVDFDNPTIQPDRMVFARFTVALP
jgi:Flp pilus assembly protein TadD